MLTISKKKNYRIIKKAISSKFIENFQVELNNLVNKKIKKKNLNLDRHLSLDLKLLSFEEINHDYISELYGDIKKFKIIKNFERQKEIRKILLSFFNKKFFNHTKAVRLDLSNNKNWNLDWHQENSYVGRKNKFIFFWFPLLNKNDSSTGGLEIYDKFTSKAYNFNVKKKKNSQIQKTPNIKLKKDYYKEVKLNIGDLLVFDKYLFHKSVANNSFKSKLSCVMSFYEKTE